MPELLEGTTGLVVGVANKRSIAWAIARKLDEAGQRLVLTYQGERTEGDVRKLAETLTDCAAVLPLDVQDDAQVAARGGRRRGGARRAPHPRPRRRVRPARGPRRAASSTPSREGFHLALDVSAYSLAALAREAEPHMRAGGGGSIMTLSYIAADRAVPGLQRDGGRQGGPRGDRPLPGVGPRRRAASASTRSRPGRCGRSPPAASPASARWPTPSAEPRARCGATSPQDEVADAAVFLASPLSASVTGETIFVDAGFHAMGL